MRTAVEALGVALAADDIGARAHAAGNDAEIALARPDRSLPGDPYVLAEMVLALDVVVVAVDGLDDGANLAAERRADRAQRGRHHRLAVHHGEALRPADGFDIVFEILLALRQVSEILVRQIDEPAPHMLLGALDEIAADGVADAARARMQHHPHPLLGVEAHLDEMVAGPERAEMVRRPLAGTLQLRMLADDQFQAGDEIVPTIVAAERAMGRLRNVAPGATIGGATVICAAMRHRGLDRGADAGEAVRQIAGAELGPRRHHPAANIDADRRRHDGAKRRNDAAHRRAHAPMYVRHRRNMVIDERERGDIAQLLHCLVFDGHVTRPHLERRAARLLVIDETLLGHVLVTSSRRAKGRVMVPVPYPSRARTRNPPEGRSAEIRARRAIARSWSSAAAASAGEDGRRPSCARCTQRMPTGCSSIPSYRP